jgi:hypothetical protein
MYVCLSVSLSCVHKMCVYVFVSVSLCVCVGVVG